MKILLLQICKFLFFQQKYDLVFRDRMNLFVVIGRRSKEGHKNDKIQKHSKQTKKTS